MAFLPIVRSPDVKLTGTDAPAGRLARVPAPRAGGQRERAQREHVQRAGAKRGREAQLDGAERYRRLPTGAHGLAREEVQRDQRARLRRAMIELIAERGYPAVRILDLTKLAHVSRSTFYDLYRDKEAVLLEAYDEIAARATRVVIRPHDDPRRCHWSCSAPSARVRRCWNAAAPCSALSRRGSSRVSTALRPGQPAS